MWEQPALPGHGIFFVQILRMGIQCTTGVILHCLFGVQTDVTVHM